MSLASGGAPTTTVNVPTLVMKGNKLGRPIIGSNGIDLIIDSKSEQSNAIDIECLSHTVRTAFPNLEPEQARAFVQLVSVKQKWEYAVKTGERINIAKYMSVTEECHVQIYPPHEDTTMIFEPERPLLDRGTGNL